MRNRRLGWVLGIIGSLAATAATAQPRAPYDGRWMVVIRSVSGPCVSSGGYALSIRNGAVSYAGILPIDVRGRVDRLGRVMVDLSGGSERAHAAGRLFKTAGTGTWRGRSRQRACSGKWWAQRR